MTDLGLNKSLLYPGVVEQLFAAQFQGLDWFRIKWLIWLSGILCCIWDHICITGVLKMM